MEIHKSFLYPVNTLDQGSGLHDLTARIDVSPAGSRGSGGRVMLGRPGHPALVLENYVRNLVGGNSLWANLVASLSGAFMYFATLTEIPIPQGLIGSGMGKGMEFV
jgi:hypothetical protein